MDHDEYRRRDIPIKCTRCRRWMRRNKIRKDGSKTRRQYVTRALAPNAGHCVECFEKLERSK